jgi:hypothetical protein
MSLLGRRYSFGPGSNNWPSDVFPGEPKFAFGKIERVSKGNEGGIRSKTIRHRRPGSFAYFAEEYG